MDYVVEEKHSFTLAERQSHRIFFWSYPLFVGLGGAFFVFWGQVAMDKAWLLSLLVALGVANAMHWGDVQYGGWRHALDSAMAVLTAVVHEVCALRSLPVEDGVDYQKIRIVPLYGEPRSLGYNVLRSLDPCFWYIFGVCMILNLGAVGAYLIGWHAHKLSGCPPADKSVRDGCYLHLLFRLFAMLAVLIVYAGDLSAFTQEKLWLGVAVIVIGYGVAHVAAWWLMVPSDSRSPALADYGHLRDSADDLKPASRV